MQEYKEVSNSQQKGKEKKDDEIDLTQKIESFAGSLKRTIFKQQEMG